MSYPMCLIQCDRGGSMSKSNFDGKEYGNEERTFNSVRHCALNKSFHLDSSVLTLVMWNTYFKPH